MCKRQPFFTRRGILAFNKRNGFLTARHALSGKVRGAGSLHSYADAVPLKANRDAVRSGTNLATGTRNSV